MSDTVREFREQLELAIANQSFVRLDFLGISTKWDNLPAIQARNNAIRLMRGYSPITRFLCKHILPRLFPRELEWLSREIDRLNHLAAEQWENEVRARGEKILQEMSQDV